MKLKSWLNKRAILNSSTEPGQIPVRLKDGSQRWLQFSGFIDKTRVERLSTQQNVQWVKLVVFAVIDDLGEWTDVKEGDYLLGIFYQNVVWAVLEGDKPLILLREGS